jgi:hypothetical protein
LHDAFDFSGMCGALGGSAGTGQLAHCRARGACSYSRRLLGVALCDCSSANRTQNQRIRSRDESRTQQGSRRVPGTAQGSRNGPVLGACRSR